MVLHQIPKGWKTPTEKLFSKKLFCGLTPGFFKHLAKFLSSWFRAEHNEGYSSLVFICISSSDVETLIWSDGMTGGGPIVAHLNIFQLGCADLRVVSVSAIRPHQPLWSYVDCGSCGLVTTENPLFLTEGDSLTAHQNIGFDIAQPIFCSMSTHSGFQILIQCFQCAGVCYTSNCVHLSILPGRPLIEQDFPCIAS